MQFTVGTSGYSYQRMERGLLPQEAAAEGDAELLRRAIRRGGNQQLVLQDAGRRRSGVVVWQVPESFRFAFKAPQTITQRKRLKDAADATKYFLESTAVLGGRRGPLLFQLPPNFKKDLGRLGAFLANLSQKAQASFELRHESWF